MNYVNFNKILGSKNMKHLAVLSALSLSFTLAACGPEKSQLDLERETKAEKIKQKSDENDRLVGSYAGEVTYQGQTLGLLLLDLHKQDEVANPNELDPTFVPTVQGTLWLNLSTEERQTKPSSTTKYWERLNVERVAYDGGSKVGLLGALPGAKSTISINGIFNGTDTITGIYYSEEGIKLPNGEILNSLDVVLRKK
jgi:hypothetical protein